MLIDNITIEEVKKAIKKSLPGKNAHLKMIPKDRNLIIPDKNINKFIDSAVLMLLFNNEDKLYFCFIKRSMKLKYHPGQISFPVERLKKENLTFQSLLLEKPMKK
jgi:hypothetical protein